MGQTIKESAQECHQSISQIFVCCIDEIKEYCCCWGWEQIEAPQNSFISDQREWRKFSLDWTIQIEVLGILFTFSFSDSFELLRLRFFISFLSSVQSFHWKIVVLYRGKSDININATWIKILLFLFDSWLFWSFSFYVSFYQKAQFVTRVTSGFFSQFLPAGWWQINVITLSSPSHTKQSITKAMKCNNKKTNPIWGKWKCFTKSDLPKEQNLGGKPLQVWTNLLTSQPSTAGP